MNNWVIWSEEHQAWWRPSSAGYTGSLKRAGRYSGEEATKIMAGANNGGRNFNELIFPLPDDFDTLAGKETRR